MVDYAGLYAAQQACFAPFSQLFPLSERDQGFNPWAAGMWQGKIQGFAGEPKLGWVTVAQHATASGECFGELTAWVAPSFDVPHLILQHSIDNVGRLVLTMDYVARYDLCAESYHYDEFFRPLEGWRASCLGAGTEPPADQDALVRLISSPMRTSVVLPAAETSQDQAQQMMMEHCQRWCSWWSGAAEVNRMKRGSLFARDTKMHRARFASHVSRLSRAGVDGSTAEQLAQALVGPGDEQYVGQAS